jgi:hypothetical protein
MNRIWTNQLTLGQSMSALISDTWMAMTQGIGDAVGRAIVFSEDLGQALKATFKNVLASVISALVTMGIQRLILTAIFGAASAREAAAEMSKGLAAVYINSFASAAAIPLYGWAIAPYVATANTAMAAAGASAAGATGAGLGSSLIAGQAHAGMENVPREGTFLLDKGERVLAPEQNQDLTDFLSGEAAGGVNIGQLNITIAVPDSKALIEMDRNDWREIVARSIIPAMDVLGRSGVRPEASERGRGN